LFLDLLLLRYYQAFGGRADPRFNGGHIFVVDSVVVLLLATAGPRLQISRHFHILFSVAYGHPKKKYVLL